jgi:transposase InsO family protein
VRDLLPILDSAGHLRVGGRVRNASLDADNKHPLIIPHRSPISMLIAREFHNVAHLGTEWTLGLIRRTYWITKARCILKSVKQNCLMCKKLYGHPGYQRMADLPEERLMPGKAAFSFVGTDCFGPIMVKVNRSQAKRYGCLFTCFTTRAVHVEVLSSLDTDSMINALRRFISRRGRPSKLWSDNGTNYVGCYNELSRNLKELNNGKLYDFCTKQNIEWIFNTPCSPHKGGVFERIVKTIKRVLVAVLENVRLNDEILNTVLCEVESLVNSRPITKVSEDACDPEALSPNHLLILNGGPAPIPGVFHDSDRYRKRWRHVQHVVDTFWKRWIREYLPQLHKVSKWHDVKPNLKVNDLVLVMEESTPRGLWPMGIVSDVKKSSDGLVRTVHVRTKSKELVRPITKIVLLEECT